MGLSWGPLSYTHSNPWGWPTGKIICSPQMLELPSRRFWLLHRRVFEMKQVLLGDKSQDPVTSSTYLIPDSSCKNLILFQEEAKQQQRRRLGLLITYGGTNIITSHPSFMLLHNTFILSQLLAPLHFLSTQIQHSAPHTRLPTTFEFESNPTIPLPCIFCV
jgi:hypothetical protein